MSADSAGPLAPASVGGWLRELARVPLGLVDAHMPTGRGIPARAREQLILTVVELRGGPVAVWVHGTWLDFLGHRDPDDVLEPLFAYARSCAEEGRPLDTTTLDAVYPPTVVRSVRATVAHASLGALASSAADRLARRVMSLWPGHGGPDLSDPGPGSLVSDVAVAATALPFAWPMLAVAGGMRVANALAPDLPEIDLPPDDDADLAVHLLAEAVPTYLGGTLLRTLALTLPRPVAMAVRIEESSATLRIGRGRVGVSSGIGQDALLVIEGGSEPLLKVVAASILRDLGSGRSLFRPR